MKKKLLLIYIATGCLALLATSAAYLASKKYGSLPTATITGDLWAIAAASLLTAIGVWRVRPWGFFAFLVLTATVVGKDIFNIFEKNHTSGFEDLIEFTLIAIGLIFVLFKHARAPYFTPQPERFERIQLQKEQFKAQLSYAGENKTCQILDISQSGCFVEIKTKVTVGDETHINPR